MIPRPFKYTLRVVARVVLLGVVVAALPILLGAPAATNTPYQSALSHLVASPAYAAGCPDKMCDRGVSCVSGIGYKCIRFNGRGCSATAC